MTNIGFNSTKISYSLEYGIFGIISIIISFLVMDIVKNEEHYIIITLLILTELLLFLFFSYKSIDSIINFSTLFVLCLFLFNFGQVVLLGFFPNLENYTIVLRYFTVETCYRALCYMNCAFVAVCFGILFCYGSTLKKRGVKKELSYEEYEKSIKKYALVIIAVTFPLKAFVDFTFLFKSLSGGFDNAKLWLNSVPDFLVTIANFSIVGFGLLILVYKKNRRKQLIILLAIMSYFLTIILSGRRSETISYMLVLALVFIVSRGKIKFRKMLFLGVLAYILLAFLNCVVTIRNSEVVNSTVIIESFIYGLTKKNILFEALREYGNTGYTSICVLELWLPKYSPSYGKSYFLGMSSIFINITGLSGKLTRASNYGFTLQEMGALSPHYTNIGGSIIGEAFFNFGIVGGIVFSVVIGLLVGCVSKKVQSQIVGELNHKFAYYLAIMYALLYWIRDYFSGGIRGVVWGIIFCWIMSKIFIRKKIK